MPRWTPESRLLAALGQVSEALSHMGQLARETPHASRDALAAHKLLEQAEQVMGRDIARDLSLPPAVRGASRTDLVRLAADQPELRAKLVPYLRKTAAIQFFRGHKLKLKKGDLLVNVMGHGLYFVLGTVTKDSPKMPKPDASPSEMNLYTPYTGPKGKQDIYYNPTTSGSTPVMGNILVVRGGKVDISDRGTYQDLVDNYGFPPDMSRVPFLR